MLYMYHWIGATMKRDRKMKWMLDAIEHIYNRYTDVILRGDYYSFFILQFNKVLDMTFHTVDGVFVRKNVTDLSVTDIANIKEKIVDLVDQWNENKRFLSQVDTLYAKVREVHKFLQVLKVIMNENFDDKKRWTFYYENDAYHITISAPGDINQGQQENFTENPENDEFLFEDCVNPARANVNPTRRRMVGLNPANHDESGSTNPVRHMLFQLEHYI